MTSAVKAPDYPDSIKYLLSECHWGVGSLICHSWQVAQTLTEYVNPYYWISIRVTKFYKWIIELMDISYRESGIYENGNVRK